MRFRQKHPYLFWQLIGWGIVAASFAGAVFAIVILEMPFADAGIAVIVITEILASSIVFLSPPIIWIKETRNREEQARKAQISALYHQTHKAVPLIVFFSTLLLFLVSIGAIIRFWLFFFGVLAVYPAAIPYLLYMRAMKRWFYQIPNAEQHCCVCDLSVPEELELLERTPVLVYFDVTPDDVFLHFIYNFYAKSGILKQQNIHFLRVPCELLRQKYDFLSCNGSDSVLCITAEEIDITESGIEDFQPRCALFDGWIAASRWRCSEMPQLIQTLFRAHAHDSENDLHTYFASNGLSADEEGFMLQELGDICGLAYDLEKDVRKNKLTMAGARDSLLTHFSYLSREDADLILTQTAGKWKHR